MSVCRLANYRQLDENELDAMLFGLSLDCPFGCESRCPLGSLREKPLRERLRAITAMSHRGKLRLMARLTACYRDHAAGGAAGENT